MKPFCCIENFWTEAQNQELYKLAIAKSNRFSSTASRTNSIHYPDWRKSQVLYHWDFSDYYAKLSQSVKEVLPSVCDDLGIPAFNPDKIEIQLTAHNNGEYYKRHTDNGSPPTATRIVTFVYYFWNLPQAFTGGELHLLKPEALITPKNNSIIFFDSSIYHEVLPVVCSSQKFEDGRFTLNGWVRK